MKNLVTTMGVLIVALLLTVGSITIYTKDSKRKEIQSAVTEAMEQTVENLKEPDLKTKNEAEMSDYFVAQLSKRISSVDAIKVNIYEIDYVNGLIDAEVTAYFPYLIGSGNVKVRKTIYLDNVPLSGNRKDYSDNSIEEETETEPSSTLSLTTNKSVTASSVLYDKEEETNEEGEVGKASTYSEEHIIDGDKNTYWESYFDCVTHDENDQWVVVDIGSLALVNRIEIIWGDNFAKSYKVQVSEDNKKWLTPYETKFGDGSTCGLTFSEMHIRYIRVKMTSKYMQTKGYQIKEINAYTKDADVELTPPTNMGTYKITENVIIKSPNSTYSMLHNAIDGDMTTVFASDSQKDPYVLIDLGNTYSIYKITFLFGVMDSSFKIECSETGGEWKNYSYSQQTLKSASVYAGMANIRFIKFRATSLDKKNYSIEEVTIVVNS